MSENNGTGYATPQDLTSHARRDVETPSGLRLQIRAIGPAAFVKIQRAIPDVVAIAGDESEVSARVSEKIQQRPETMQELDRVIDEILMEGVLQPRLVADAAQGATPRDFTFDDRLFLMTQIRELSGFSKEAAQKVRPFSRPGA